MEKKDRIEAYYDQAHPFREGISLLRDLALQAGARETFKWRAPVYTAHDGTNIFWIARFKNHFGLGFFQGALLKDPDNVLINAQEEKTVSMRHWRFTSHADIPSPAVLRYMAEALENQALHSEQKPQRRHPEARKLPSHLQEAFHDNKALRQGFSQLAPYKQREYIEYIADAKREDTKVSRLQKIIPLILEGRGLNDKYR